MTRGTEKSMSPLAALRDDISRCVHCGFCLQACPTYVELGMETDSPRGRIALIDAVASGSARATPALLGHLDLCLQCRACETACPSGVAFGRIMEEGRAMAVESGARPPSWALRIAAMRLVLPHPGRVRALMTSLRLYQRSPVHTLIRRTGLLGRISRSLDDAEQSMPVIPSVPFTLPRQPRGLTKAVAMLTGCVMPHLYPRTHEATVRVLNRLGYRVVVPEAQTCCGALNLHGGDRIFARDLARRNIDAFLDAGVEAVIVNSAGCGSTMKEYDHLLAGDAAYRDRARQFVAITRDVLEFVAEHDLGQLGEVRATVTYQDSCHLVHGQKITAAPRRVMSAIPGIDLRELSAPDRCCGSAGLYNVVQRGMASRLLARKVDDVVATHAAVVATANPGCMMQIEAGLRQRRIDARVVHVIELLDEAMRAAPRERTGSNSSPAAVP
jgi:glycolate oxidase iron-sulfur subunit